MRNRWYDPNTGRFTQEDPIGYGGGINLYGYVGGDPVNYSDPFGLCPGLNGSPSVFDCPPGYFTLLGTIVGAIGGFFTGAGTGLAVAAPTAELAAPITVPVGAIGGTVAGALQGAATGAALDGAVQIANAGHGRAGNRKPNADAEQIAKDSNLNRSGRRALHDAITGKDLDLDDIRGIAEDLAKQTKYVNPSSP